MEEKINKAAILKDKPKGTKLYTILSDSECFLNEASEDSIYIDIDNRERFWCLSAYGSTHSFPNGCVLLFPSKEMRDWSKFAWKKGDVLVSNDGGTEVVFDKWYDETYTSFYCKHYLNSEDENKIVYLETFLCTTERYSLEDKDSVQTYINTIEERLGGKLNGETLEIEKAEFKYGDIAFADYGNRQIVFVVSSKTDIKEGYNSFISLCLNGITTLDMGYRRSFFKKDLFELRLATEAEKQQLFSALKKQSKVWDAEKKMIVDLKPKVELKPFDKVVVRCSEADRWSIDFFSYKAPNGYICTGDAWFGYCLPYNEETAKLIGTTKDMEV